MNAKKGEVMEKVKIPQKETICVRLKPKTIEKIDKLRENKEEKRSEFLRKIIEKAIELF